MSDVSVAGMRVAETSLPGVRIIEPQVFEDGRGYLFELYGVDRWTRAGLELAVVQDNVAVSLRGVLRGLHFQHPSPQGKIVTVVDGEIFDVSVDIRTGSPTFGRWLGVSLSASNHRVVVVPEGFAHGFVVTTARAVVLYKFTAPYLPEAEGGIAWDDPDLGVLWPIHGSPIVSEKDQRRPRLRDIPPEKLPKYVPDVVAAKVDPCAG